MERGGLAGAAGGGPLLRRAPDGLGRNRFRLGPVWGTRPRHLLRPQRAPGVAEEKPYAEKLLVVGEKQETPFHFHKVKMEDIIVRGGGNLIIEFYNPQAAAALPTRRWP